MKLAARRRRTAVLLLYCPMLLIGQLAGCGGLLPKAPERPLYRLTYSTGTVAAAPAQSPRQVPALLVIATPTASAGLDTKRMAVINSPFGIDYFAEGEWVDRLPFLVKEALIEGFQKSGAFAGVSSEGLGLSADYVLSTDIRDFSATYDASGGAPLARIRIAAELITMPGRNIAAATSVTREARAAANDLPSIVLAFDRALGEAVQDLIGWSANQPASSAKRG